MIQLEAYPKPVELTDELVADLTAKFKDDGTAVWKKKFITDALEAMSYRKCAYCECKLNEEGKYLQVEHFHHKDKYKDEVVLWSNLLPSCNRCNLKKGTHDTVLKPLIHPVRDAPKEHLSFQQYRFKGKTEIGERTIKKLRLNDRKHLQNKRYEIGSKLLEEVEDVLEKVRDFKQGINTSVRKLDKISDIFWNLMEECTPQASYAATTSTILLNDDAYPKIKTFLQTQNLWNEAFEQLEAAVQYCALDLANNRSHPDTIIA